MNENKTAPMVAVRAFGREAVKFVKLGHPITAARYARVAVHLVLQQERAKGAK